MLPISMIPTREFWYRMPEVRYGFALLITALIAVVVWWSDRYPSPGSLSGCVLLHGEWRWTDAEVAGGDPAIDDAGWERTVLPGRQAIRDLRSGRSRWFRHRFIPPADLPPTGLVLVLGPVHADHEVWLNGRRFVAVGQSAGEASVDFARPRVYGVPVDLLQPGRPNLLALWTQNRLPEEIGPQGRILAIGPIERLQDWIEAGDRSQVVFNAMLLALGCFFLMLSHHRSTGSHYWSLALGTVTLGLHGLIRSGWLRIPGLDAVEQVTLNDMLVLLPGPLLFHFICRTVLRDHVPAPLAIASRWLFAYPVAATGAILLGGLPVGEFIDGYLNDAVLVLLSLIVTVLALRGTAQGDRHARVLTGAIVFFAGTVLFEVIVSQQRLLLPRYIHSIGLLQLILTMAVVVSQRIESLQRETERANRRLLAFNQELEQRVAERTVALAESNTTLDRRNREQVELLHVLCHDLANPIGAIVGALELIHGDRQHLDRMLPLMRLAGGNATATIENIRDLHSMTDRPLRLCPVVLATVVADSVRLLEPRFQAKDHTVDQDVPADLAVLAEPIALMNSVFANLLTNAIKFTRRGGRIAIRARRDPAGVVVTVVDDGIGIPSALLGEIFHLGGLTNRPGTEGESGTGYGLPMVYRYMGLFGGSITITSREQVGTDGPAGGTEVRLIFKPA